MRPTLAVVPPFPGALLIPAFLLCIVLGLAFASRAARSSPRGERGDVAFPLILAGGAAFAFWLWARQPIVLHSYGLFLVFGFALAVWLSCREAERRGLDPNIIIDLSLPLLAFSVLACRLLYVALNRDQFQTFGQVLRVWDGGLSFHGSLVAAPLVVWYFARRAGLTFWQLGDVIAPSVFAGYAVGRIGCLMNGCCYGHACELPWAMTFPVEGNRTLTTPPSHPTQLYSTMLASGLFFVMQRIKVSPRWNQFAGQITIIFFALYLVERGFIELFRRGATAKRIFGSEWLTQAQLASIMGLVALAAVYAVMQSRAVARGDVLSRG